MSNSSEHSVHISAQTVLTNPHALTPLILFMGFLGASLRYALELALPAEGGFPFATLIINLFGCFVLEIINNFIGKKLNVPGPLVKSMGIGLVGAFTTIAAFSTECINLVLTEQYITSFLYITLTWALSFIAAMLGHTVSNRMGRSWEKKHRSAEGGKQ